MSFSSTESKLHEKIILAVFKQEFSVGIFEYSFAKQLLLNTFHIFIEAFETAFSLLQLEPRTSLSLTADLHVFQRCFNPVHPTPPGGGGGWARLIETISCIGACEQNEPPTHKRDDFSAV